MLFDFIRITNEVISKELPNLLITNVNYRCDEGTMIMNFRFYDTDFKIKGLQFMYYEVPNPLIDIEYNLVLEFTAYLDEHVKPIYES